jgi:hypothetical protein
MAAELYDAYYSPHFRLQVTPEETTGRQFAATGMAAIEAEGSRSTG